MGKKHVNTESYFLPEKRHRLGQISGESQEYFRHLFVFKYLGLNIFEGRGFRDLCSTGVFSDILFGTQQLTIIVQAYDTPNGIAEKRKQVESISLTADHARQWQWMGAGQLAHVLLRKYRYIKEHNGLEMSLLLTYTK
jgi:hypothetical protein